MADAPETSNSLEESDRGCVLVGAATLNEALATVFNAVFNRNGISRKTHHDLFVANGPLAGFSGKIKLAYAMCLIDRQTFENLDTIRRVCNEFLHTQARADFPIVRLTTTGTAVR